MKYLTLLLCLLAGLCLNAQSLLQGLVTEQHSGRALAGVTVSAFGGSQDQTDVNGRFQLGFSNKEPGEAVQLLIDDARGDKMVVNQKELESLRIPASTDELIRVVMADQTKLEEARQRYYEIIFPHTKRSVEQKRETILSMLQQPIDGQLSQVLNAQISSLRTDSASLGLQAEKLADYLATIDLDQASKLQQKALRSIERGEVDAALELLSKERLEKQYDKASRRLKKAEEAIEAVVQAYRMKAQLLEGSFQLFEAAACWNKIADIHEEQSGDPGLIADALETAGWLLEKGGEYREADRIFRTTIRYRESMEYPNQHLLALSYGKLGRLLNRNGRYDSALQYLDKSREMLLAEGDTLSEHLGTAYSQIGVVFMNQGDYEQALTMLLKAETIKEAVLPPFDPEKGALYNNLATCYNDIQQNDKALAYHEKALAVLHASFDEPHPNFAKVYNNMASVYRSMGNYDQAIRYQNMALETQRKVNWEFHPDLGISYINQGGNYLYTDKPDSALLCFQKGKDILSTSLDSTHPIIAISYHNIARAHQDLGAFEKAIASQRKSLKITSLHYPEDHPEVGLTYGSMGVTFQRMGAMDSAKAYLHRSLDIIAKSHKEGKRSHAIQLSLMGDFYREMEDYEQAEHYLLAADSLWQKEELKGHPRRIRHEKVWLKALTDQGKVEKAMAKIRLMIALGFSDREWLEKEKSLARLREMPDFKKLITEMSKPDE